MRPAPLWGAGLAQGGGRRTKEQAHSRQPQVFPAKFQIAPNFFRQFWFSSGTFLELSDFKPKKIRPEKFQSKIFYDFQLSTGKFSGFSNFAAKKSPDFPVPVPGPCCRIHDGDASQLPYLHLFFQLSRQFFFLFQLSIQNFLQFSTFEPKKIGRTNFHAKNFCPEKISDRTSGTRSIRSACNGLRHLRRETCNNSRFFQLSRRSFYKFLARMFIQSQKFRDNRPKKVSDRQDSTSRQPS